MNPVIIAAAAISLLAVGAVSMTSLSAQQAANSAGMQRMDLERDRLYEQTNAYISSVATSGSNTIATVKNTGSSALTVDHCLAVSPLANSIRPAAAKTAVGQTVKSGSAIDVTLSGIVSADNIKCVTSKGTVLPVRIASAATNGGLVDPADYIDSFAVTAGLTVASNEHFTNSAYTPWAKPSPPAKGTGSLTYYIPVAKPITVNYVAREAPDGTIVTLVPDGSSIQYSAGQTIPVTIAGPTNKVTVKFTPPGNTDQLTATVRPSFVEISALSGNTKTSSGSATTGVAFGYYVDPAYNRWYDGYVAIYSGTAGLIGANGWIFPLPPPQYCVGGSTSMDGKVHCSRTYTTLYSSPEIVQTYSFPAPKSTVKVTLYYDASARDYATNCHVYGCPFSMSSTLDLGAGGSLSIPVAYNTPYSGYRSDTIEGSKSGTVTFMLTGLTPGQQVDIPVKLLSSISSESATVYVGNGRYVKGDINYTASLSTQLFID
ncbi:hypothetical protein [Nitrososphaera sp.]|uniref:hypothetical protein n=1 Tax=Nitrososphaera sp. TaxID=1971748 RepID=UPI00307D5D96